MQLERLGLISFRNYDQTEFTFSENNLIVGENGTGKTSILEAINILATTKSGVAKGINKCIKNGQKGFIISAHFKKEQNDLEIVFRQEKNVQRIIKVDDQIKQRSSELLGLVNSVIFLPQDIEILQGSPQLRRKYLDILISQLDAHYYQSLQKYSNLLKQRNEVLKQVRQTRNTDVLAPWDEQLLSLSEILAKYRLEYLEKLDHKVSQLYGQMGFKQPVGLRYKTELTGRLTEDKQKLLASRQIDILSGFTNFGAHRDDLLFYCGDNLAAEFCSQGQQRLLVVCLKLAEANLKKQILNDAPILLIDDVLLELDLPRFNRIIRETLAESQKIITMTDTKRLDQNLVEKMHIISLN